MYPEGFQWYEDKNEINRKNHGIDFNDASKIFERPTLDEFDDRKDYGEVRYNSIGIMDDGTCINVTHTERDGDIRIISARCADKNERKQYQEIVKEYYAEKQVDIETKHIEAQRDKVADIAAELLDILDPAPRKITADEYLANAESRSAFFEQQAAEQERNNTLDKIRHDRNTGKNLNPENMRDDLRKLGRDDLEVIKARGDDGIKHLIEERERERQRELNQGRERER